MKKTNLKFQHVFYSGLIAMMLASCGSSNKSSDSPAQAPQATPQPTPATPAAPKGPADTTTPPATNPPATTQPATPPTADALAVDITNSAAISNQTLPLGTTTIQFALKNTQTPTPGIIFKCKLEMSQSVATTTEANCTSPDQIQLQQPGQYYFTVRAIHEASGTAGLPNMIAFTVGNTQQPGQPGQQYPGQQYPGQNGQYPNQQYPNQQYPGQQGQAGIPGVGTPGYGGYGSVGQGGYPGVGGIGGVGAPGYGGPSIPVIIAPGAGCGGGVFIGTQVGPAVVGGTVGGHACYPPPPPPPCHGGCGYRH